MLSFIVVKDDEISNLIVAESKDIAETISGGTCIEYDSKLVNPKIGQSVVDGEVVDLEVYPTEEELEAARIAAEAAEEEEES
jgi:hypothetical protein